MLRRNTYILLFTLIAVFIHAGSTSALAAEADYKTMAKATAGSEMAANRSCWQCHKNEPHAGAGKEVTCDACHKPGDLTVKDEHEELGRTACDYKTFIPIGELPKQKQSEICLGCHGRDGKFTLHNWNASSHSLAGLSCVDCHNIHHGDNLKPHRPQINELCYTCHEEIRGAFMLPTHHPLPEGKMTCTDCHDPHGSPNPGVSLRRETVKETCTRCHAEKEGPFVFEHADLMEDCTICHNPHGSQNDWLLAERQPYLCKQCHAQHGEFLTSTNALCTNCHNTIHGTDLDSSPFAPGEGLFLR